MSIFSKIITRVKENYKIFSEEDYERYSWAFRHDNIIINRYKNEEDANNAAEILVKGNAVAQVEVKPVTVFEKDDTGGVRKHICYDMIFDGRDVYYFRKDYGDRTDEEYYLALNEYIKAIKAGGSPKTRVIGWVR